MVLRNFFWIGFGLNLLPRLPASLSRRAEPAGKVKKKDGLVYAPGFDLKVSRNTRSTNLFLKSSSSAYMA